MRPEQTEASEPTRYQEKGWERVALVTLASTLGAFLRLDKQYFRDLHGISKGTYIRRDAPANQV